MFYMLYTIISPMYILLVWQKRFRPMLKPIYKVYSSETRGPSVFIEVLKVSVTLEGVSLGPPLVGDGHLSITVGSVHLDLRHREGSLTDGTVHAGFGDLRDDGRFQFGRRWPLKPWSFCLLHNWIRPFLLYLLFIHMLSSQLAASTRDVSLHLSVHRSWKQSQMLSF